MPQSGHRGTVQSVRPLDRMYKLPSGYVSEGEQSESRGKWIFDGLPAVSLVDGQLGWGCPGQRAEEVTARPASAGDLQPSSRTNDWEAEPLSANDAGDNSCPARPRAIRRT